MSFDHDYYRFIEELDRVQMEALNNVSRIFDEWEDQQEVISSSAEQDHSDLGSSGPEKLKSAVDGNLEHIHLIRQEIPGPEKWMPTLVLDNTGVWSWDDPFFDGKKFKCPAIITNGRYAGQQCLNEAGRKTDHVGIGRCVAHGGAKRNGRAEAGWVFMHAMALALNVTPWDALLGQIRLLAGQVAWLTQKVGEITQTDEDLLPDGVSFYWMTLLEERGKRLAQVSKMAIDAGIAERMVSMMEDQAQILHSSVQRAAIEMNLDENAQYELLTKVARNFQEIESKTHNT
jgi:hypothetical protein